MILPALFFYLFAGVCVASAVMVVVLVVGNFLGQLGFAEEGEPVFRLWTPWILWHSGTEDDGTSTLYSGNAVFSVVYLLCLCAAAAIFAIRHDRTARTPRLRQAFAAVVVVGLAALTLSGVCEAQVFSPRGKSVEEKQGKVRKQRDEMLNELYAAKPEMRGKLENAAGYATFKTKDINLLLVSSGSGYGLVVDKQGKETYMRVASLGDLTPEERSALK